MLLISMLEKYQACVCSPNGTASVAGFRAAMACVASA